MTADYRKGFADQTREISVPSLKVEGTAELPRIHYARCNSRPYRYVYANGIRTQAREQGQGESAFLNTVVKFDLEGETREWREDGHYPGEPVFVVRPGFQPDAQAEDDGILLTVVLDAAANSSYLLLLDARDLSEIARARVPQHVPFGFHGTYARS